MTPEEKAMMDYTITHFQEIARQNRFPENGDIPHEREQCAVCHPEKIARDPFLVYLEIITQSIKARRPQLNEELIQTINSGLEAAGETYRISMASVLSGEPQAMAAWAQWGREAVATGLGLISIHSSSSLDFDPDDEDITRHFGKVVESSVNEIMEYQRQSRQAGATD